MQTINFDLVDLKKGQALLDVGCGEGRHAMGALFNNPHISVAAIDLKLSDLNTARLRHQEFDKHSASHCLYTQANGYRLPFADKSFDHVVCSEVLEHVDNYHTLLEEMYRVLKPGGSLNISVPRFWPEKICWALSEKYHQVEGGHIRIFRARALKRDIQNLAFEYRRRHWAHALHVPYWWLRCAFWQQGEDFILTRWYHKLLVWDLIKRPFITQAIERLINPLIGKSVVMYFIKP